MAGVIEHKRPPACEGNGKPADPITVLIQGGAYKAECPYCGKTLWLNKFSSKELPGAIDFTFPEHIGRT